MKTTLIIQRSICAFILISFLTVTSQLHAFEPQVSQTIRGKVIDRDSKFPLPGANIIVVNSNPLLGTSSNMDGVFEINNVPLGRHNIKISYIGYEPTIISNVLVGSGKEVILNVNLVESLVSLENVVVKAETAKEKPVNEMASVSARTFSVEETSRYAASINDPARMALSFAGVSIGSSDAQNLIVIRGNSPRGMLWQIEGLPVSNPNHFADEGTSGGAVCLISNNMLDNSDFMIGAWPAGFGNALSGVFDINFRQGNSETYEHAFQFGGFGVDFSSEGPLSFVEGASYLINYRYSTLSLLSAAGINIVDKDKGRPDYQDLSYKIFIPSKTFGMFSIWGIGGLSQSKSESEIATGLTYDNEEYIYLDDEGEETNSDIGIAGITHTYFPDNHSYIKTAISYNAEKLSNNEEGIYNNSVQKISEQKFTRNQLVFSTLYNRKVSSKFTFKTGIIGNYLDYGVKSSEYNSQHKRFDINVDASGGSGFYQGYFQSKYNLNNSFSFFAGLHSMFFELNDRFSLEPRLALKWKVTDLRSFTIGYGLHSQMHPLSLYLMNYVDSEGGISKINKELDFSKASHLSVSYDEMFFSDWRVKLELYYQDLYRIPIAKDTTDNNFSAEFLRSYSLLNSGSSLKYTELVNDGTGKNYGIELTVEKFLNNGWYFMSTNSFYQAKYKALDGIERDTRFNGNYTLNLLAGKEFSVGLNNILGFNVRIIRAGGKRDHPVLSPQLLFDDLGDPVIDPITGNQIVKVTDDYSRAYSKQLDDYFRVDLGISYRLNFSNTAHIISLDVQNIFNRENIRKIDEYDVDKKEYVYKYQAGIIPSFNYRIEF